MHVYIKYIYIYTHRFPPASRLGSSRPGSSVVVVVVEVVEVVVVVVVVVVKQ